MLTAEQEPTMDTPKPDVVLYKRGELTIRSAEQYAEVAEGLALNKGWQKRVKEFFAPLKQKANEAHSALCKKENETLAPALEDERARKQALESYDSEQRRLAQEEQRKRDLEERERNETRRREEEARRIAEAAALETAANQSGDESLRAEAEAIVQAPVQVPQATVTVTPALPEVKGLSFSDEWKVPVDEKKRPINVNLLALCLAIAKSESAFERATWLGLITLDVSAANKVFQNSKGKAVVPGVPCVHRRVPSSTAK